MASSSITFPSPVISYRVFCLVRVYVKIFYFIVRSCPLASCARFFVANMEIFVSSLTQFSRKEAPKFILTACRWSPVCLSFCVRRTQLDSAWLSFMETCMHMQLYIASQQFLHAWRLTDWSEAATRFEMRKTSSISLFLHQMLTVVGCPYRDFCQEWYLGNGVFLQGLC